MKRRIICLLALTCLLAVFCGCAKGGNEGSLAEGFGYIYYQNMTGTGLVRQSYQYQNTDTENCIFEAMEEMRKVDTANEVVSVLPSSVVLLGVQIKSGTTILNFNSAYNQMKAQEEILCRAAVVKTLVQLGGVDRVTFLVENQPLTGAGQTAIGNMTADSFVDSTWKDIKSVTLELYFASKDGTSLVREEREVQYYGTISLERLVVEQLIAGPSEKLLEQGVQPTLPSDLKITSISSRDNVCYVDFNSSFSMEARDLPGTLIVYSIVNSLTDLSGISQVGITENGVAGTLKEVSLDKPMDRNLHYIMPTY